MNNEKKEKSKIAFDKQASTYDSDIKGEHARKLYPFLKKEISHINYERLLDMGCGTGEVLFEIIKEDSKIEYYGLDISEKMVEIARTKLQGKAEIVVGDSEFLPYENDFFDVVCCNDSFHHYPNPKKVLKQVHRVLKPGGIFILSDVWQPLIGRVLMNAYMKHSEEGDVKIYSKAEIVNMLKDEFCDINWKKISQVSYVCLAKKYS